MATTDIVIRGEMPAEIRHSVELWAGCVAGALEESVYRETLQRAGFEQISIEPTRIYRAEDARGILTSGGLADDATIAAIDGRIMAAFVRGTKPLTAGTTFTPSASKGAAKPAPVL